MIYSNLIKQSNYILGNWLVNKLAGQRIFRDSIKTNTSRTEDLSYGEGTTTPP